MKKILFLIIAISGFEIGKIFSLLVIYSSPNQVPNMFESSIFFLGSSIFISSFFYNMDNNDTATWNWLYLIVGIIILAESIPFIYALSVDNRVNILLDTLTFSIYIFSNFLILTSFLLMLKNKFYKVSM